MKSIPQQKEIRLNTTWAPSHLAALLTGLLLVSGAVRPLLADAGFSFEASVLVTITSVEGNALQALLTGDATIDGVTEPFEGDLTETLVGLGAAAVGMMELRFDDDSSLTLLFADEAASGVLHGAWTVIDGTGRFENAQGGGWGEGFFLDDTTSPPQDPDQPQMAFIKVVGTVILL